MAVGMALNNSSNINGEIDPKALIAVHIGLTILLLPGTIVYLVELIKKNYHSFFSEASFIMQIVLQAIGLIIAFCYMIYWLL